MCKICYHYELCKEDERCLPEYLNCNFFKCKNEVVEVVRCAECRYYKTNTDRENYCDIHSTRWDKFYVNEKEYCSRGEKQ